MTSPPIRSTDPIIIVDDDLDDHFIFREISGRLQLVNELKFFKNANELLGYLRHTEDHPFVIFCDINMPIITGIELRRKIDADEALRRKSIPFVFFSTAASKPQVLEAYEMSVQGFFLKQPSFIETERIFKLILEYWDASLHPNTIK
jgi:CheY-like chemotaxis protein